MATFTNDSKGLRGVVLRNGERVWIEPGETLEMARAAIKALPDGVMEAEGEPVEPSPSSTSSTTRGRRRKTGA